MARPARRRRAPVPRLLVASLATLPRPPRRVVAAALVGLAVLLPAGFWLRDSSLVAVEHVDIRGVSGPQAAEVRQALDAAARRMTTLHVDDGALRAAVREFPVVAGVTASGHLLHTLDVRVQEHVPVAALSDGGQRLAVAADGTILPGTLTAGLPTVPVGAPPGGRQLAERGPLRLVALLAAAPAALRPRVARVGTTTNGLTAWLVRGPQLWFGPATRLQAKWIAAARVLADPTSRGASYLDLRVPERPAAGGFAATNPQPVVQPAP
jgi:cell division protein FtsQ